MDKKSPQLDLTKKIQEDKNLKIILKETKKVKLQKKNTNTTKPKISSSDEGMGDRAHWLAHGTHASVSEIHTSTHGGRIGAWRATLGS